jgi:hypothetical protein
MRLTTTFNSFVFEREADGVKIGDTGMHGIKCTCVIDEPYPCPWHGYDNRISGMAVKTSEKFLLLDFTTGEHQSFIRESNEEFRTVEWREISSGKSFTVEPNTHA